MSWRRGSGRVLPSGKSQPRQARASFVGCLRGASLPPTKGPGRQSDARAIDWMPSPQQGCCNAHHGLNTGSHGCLGSCVCTGGPDPNIPARQRARNSRAERAEKSTIRLPRHHQRRLSPVARTDLRQRRSRAQHTQEGPSHAAGQCKAAARGFPSPLPSPARGRGNGALRSATLHSGSVDRG